MPTLPSGIRPAWQLQIGDGMARTAAQALAVAAKSHGLDGTSVLPRCDDIEVANSIATAQSALEGS